MVATPSPSPHPGRRFALRIVVAGLIVLLAVGAGVAIVIWKQADDIGGILEGADDPGLTGVLDDVRSGEAQTILLVGDDHRFGDAKGTPTRSDTMMLIRLDPDAKATTMLSLPRDLEVDLPGRGTRKLNETYAGGPRNLVRTLRGLLSTPGEPFRIEHYVSIRFTAFAQAVNELRCFYVDIDRRYFNDNAGLPPGKRYAEIDVPAGYQRLCGEDSLAYVRFRHLDNDLVREARQSNYLSEARSQIAATRIFSDHNDILRAIQPYLTTDVRGSRDVLGVVKLAANIAGKPTEKIPLATRDVAGGNVAATPQALARAAHQFLHPDSVPGGAHRRARDAEGQGTPAPRSRPRRRRAATPPTVVADGGAGKRLVAGELAPRTPFPILYPTAIERRSRYDDVSSRPYDIAAADGKTYPWPAYRIVVAENPAIGQYYGIEGTTWRDPPILDLADDQERIGGRTFLVQYDGRKIRRLMLRTDRGTYWVSNTLSNALGNGEMRALARSLAVYRG
ncbi:LCP family protein [Patulibacter defluvii]|uniref:LCP family protein n=1 Tax=Patulibacter defluvii TaxID=3095358 RepID=UPI002A74FD46|nr:LCP family protein [Patulibacter sp. DM4]